MHLKLSWICFFIISGCATHPKERFSKDNFRNMAKNEIDNTQFYRVKYVGENKGCFPNDVTNTCFNYSKSSHELEIIKPLDIKSFGVNVMSWGYIGPDEKDLVYLVAAEIASQLKYKYIIDYYEYTSSGCSDSPTAHTTGTYSGKTYNSTTSVSSNTSCLFSYSIKLIAFNDYEDIKSGIASNVFNRIDPFVSIYGAGNNLRKFPDVYKLEVSGKTTTETKRNAWKKYFDVNKLIVETREKFKLGNDESIYQLKFEKPRSLEKSPRQKSQVIAD